MNIQALPIEPEQITTADASDLATAQALANDLKAKYNTLVTEVVIPLLGELNRAIETTDFEKAVTNG